MFCRRVSGLLCASWARFAVARSQRACPVRYIGVPTQRMFQVSFQVSEVFARNLSTSSICFSKKKHHESQHPKSMVPHTKPQMRFSDDFYELLEVTRTATTAEIKRAYFAKAKECHPDLNPGNQQAEALFKLISEAYSVLSDPNKREKYDQYGREGLDASDISFGETFRQLFGAGSFDDFFGDLSGELEDDNGPKDTNEFTEKRKELLKKIQEMKKEKSWRELKKELEEVERLSDLENKKDDEIHKREMESYELREKKREEVAQNLSVKLLGLISDYQVNAPERFRATLRSRIIELLESPGGLGLVEVLGNAYSLQSRQYFDDGSLPLGLSKFVAWGSSFYEKTALYWSVLSGASKLKKMQNVRNDIDKKEKKEHEENMVRTGAQTIWNFGKLLITNRIVHVCRIVLTDKKVDLTEKQRRCRAIAEMGELFLHESAENRKSRKTFGEGQWQEFTDEKKKK